MSRPSGREVFASARRRFSSLALGIRGKVLLVATISVFLVSALVAWTTIGPWWHSQQIVMRTGALGPSWQQVAGQAMSNWNTYCDPDPDFQWNQSTGSCASFGRDGLNCTGAGDLGQCSSGTVTLGVTQLWSNGNSLVEADVALNGNCSWTVSQARATLTHENGHVMGLGHSNSAAALMYAYDVGITTPRLDDCNGARHIYGSASADFVLTVSKNGSGTVTSSPSGINCGSDCSQSYSSGTSVTLSPAAASGWVFSGWSGHSDCSDGHVTMNADKSCTATFTPATYTLSVSKVGSGTVTSSPAGINCGGDCSQVYDHGTVVQLAASPSAGSVFAGWSGAADCQDGSVTMTASKSCTATFNLSVRTLAITKSGTGTGTVTSNPGGINCGGNCSHDFVQGTTVALNAAPTLDSTFVGWGGAADCTDGMVTMAAAKTCTATFDLRPTHLLEVSKDGNGSGVVTSAPSGISCGSDCQEQCFEGSLMTLTGTPAIDDELTSWGGHADCVDGLVTMTGARACTATFSSCSTQSIVDVQGDVTGPSTSSACNHLRLGPDLRVTGTGILTARAGNSVTLFNGFEVEAGGQLHVVLGQPMP